MLRNKFLHLWQRQSASEEPPPTNDVESPISTSNSFSNSPRLARAMQRMGNIGRSIESMITITSRVTREDQEEGMVAGFSLRAILGYLNTDDQNGLQVDEDGWSPLIHACVLGKVQGALTLLENGAELDLKDHEGCTALHHASRESQLDCCKLLIEKGATVEAKDSNSWTPFLWSCYIGNTEIAEILLENGADVNVRGLHHCTGLVWAAGKSNVSLVRLLLDHGAKVDTGDKYGTTPLIWGCRKGNADVVEALLEAGAQVDSTGMYSWTPLLVAVRGNYPQVVSLLLQHGPNVNAVDQEGLTALAIACKEGSTDIVYQLIAAGAYVNLQDRGGDTNLILACKGGHKNIVEALLKRYADVDTKGNDNKTCLYWAVEKNQSSIVKILLATNPDLEITSADGNTPLLKSVKNRNSEIVQMLLEKKAKVAATDKQGDTALHVAMRARSKAIVELLLRNPKNSQLLYKPNRCGETPYNIDFSNQKTILGQVFGARKLNTNEDSENMLGYDLYSSALADILTEPSLSMPITVGLYAKWGSGKSFLLKKLQEEMQNFARDWVDPTFHMSPLLFFVVLHIASVLGLLAWIVSYYQDANSFLVLFLVILVTFVISYVILFGIWQGTFKSDWYTLYNINVAVAKKFNDLRLLINIVFNHPPGPKWSGGQDKAQPLKLIFTDQSKVSTSAGAENSVIQILGSLYDSLESTYGTFSTRLFRAFRPRAVKSSSPSSLRKICCIPYAYLYILSYILALTEIILIVMKADGLKHNQIYQESTTLPLVNITEELPLSLYEAKSSSSDLDSLVVSLLITLTVILGVLVVANIYTIGQTLNALVFSQRTHLQRAVAKHDVINSEGYLQAVKKEVVLLMEMVRGLDAFSGQQSRLIVVVDGLDSVEQRKVLSVLDTVHTLFSDPQSPFIILLAIDPHVITKAIELNLNQVFSDTSIGGDAYLRNMVHLPFFLQNSGLRKVKAAQQVANKLKMSHSWYENEDRRCSMESEEQSALSLGLRKVSKKRSRVGSESEFGSLASNLNKITQGPLEVNKMFLTDDYFSDVNPRSMRRLMNVIYVMGRLLKAFSIDFNWHHLASWANITEQWPYHTSWIILFVENYGEKLEDNMSLKQVFDKVHPYIPTQKEIEPLIEYDRDRKKLDVFLSLHKKTLTIADIKVYMPFTINLDPYLRKVIKEEVHNMEEYGLSLFSKPSKDQEVYRSHEQSHAQNKAMLTRRQAVELSKKMSDIGVNNPNLLTPSLTPGHPYMNLIPPSYNYGQQPGYGVVGAGAISPEQHRKLTPSRPILPRELQGMILSSLNLDQVCLLIRTIEGINTSMTDTYCSSIISNNITGQVLLHCQVLELKSVLNMNFGDWELFKLVLNGMKEDEQSGPPRNQYQRHDDHQDNSRETDNKSRQHRKQSNIEKQVAMEEATVSGLLSTLNEDAKEDILLEEIEIAKEEATIKSKSNLDQSSQEVEESDFLYYSHPTSGPKMLGKDDNPGDMEKGKIRLQSSDMIWSAASSRRGSIESIIAGNSPGSASKRTLTRANTSKSFLRPRSKSTLEDEDPYSWLSVTAPPSPRSQGDHELNSRMKYFSDSNTNDRESDPGLQQSKLSIFSNKSVRRTKKRHSSKDTNPDESDDNNAGLTRTSSRVKMDKFKRKMRNALTSNEPGQLPMVQRAKPNPDEYQQFNKSQKTSRNSSFSESVCLSDESLSSPEQQTIAKRPDVLESTRPTVQNLFPAAKEEEEFALMTATLPDGSKMTSTKKIFTIGDSEKQDKNDQ